MSAKEYGMDLDGLAVGFHWSSRSDLTAETFGDQTDY